MASISSLCRSLRDAGIAAPQHHQLSYTFPAVHLLPEGYEPHIEVPQNITCRDKPIIEEHQPRTGELDYFCMFKISAGPVTLPDYDHDCIREAMSRLQHAPGRSTLDAVSFVNGEEIFYRFRLTTAWQLPGDETIEVKEFELSDNEWDLYRTVAEADLWMLVLQDLMRRSSARAYFHVMDKLLRYDAGFARLEASRHDHMWGVAVLPTATQLLARRLRHVYYDLSGICRKKRIADFEIYANDERVCFEFPCGHSSVMDLTELRGLSDAGCFNVKCNDELCGAFAMKEQDAEIMELQAQKDACARYLQKQKRWGAHDAAVTDSNTAIHVRNSTLLDSFEQALFSLEAPESVTPYRLSLFYALETGTISAMLKEYIGKRDVNEHTTPSRLFEELFEVVRGTLGDGPLSQRFEPFLHRVLNRTVNHVTETKKGRADINGILQEMEDMEL